MINEKVFDNILKTKTPILQKEHQQTIAANLREFAELGNFWRKNASVDAKTIGQLFLQMLFDCLEIIETKNYRAWVRNEAPLPPEPETVSPLDWKD